MTPRSLFAVLVAAIGVWYLCSAATLLLSMMTGHFAMFSSGLVGLATLLIAKSIFSNHGNPPAQY